MLLCQLLMVATVGRKDFTSSPAQKALIVPLVSLGPLRALAPVTQHVSSLTVKAGESQPWFLPGISPLPSPCQRWSQGWCWIWLLEAGACEMFRDAAAISPYPKDTEEKATPRACLQSQMSCFQHLETLLNISRGINFSPCSLGCSSLTGLLGRTPEQWSSSWLE